MSTTGILPAVSCEIAGARYRLLSRPPQVDWFDVYALDGAIHLGRVWLKEVNPDAARTAVLNLMHSRLLAAGRTFLVTLAILAPGVALL